MLRSATWELGRAWQTPRCVAAGSRRIRQSLYQVQCQYASSALLAKAPPSPRRPESYSDSDTVTIDQDPWYQRTELRRQLAADKRQEDTTPEGPSWAESNPLRRGTERKLQLAKSWTHLSPSFLIEALLASDGPSHEARKNIAMLRSYRLPIVLMQMHLRREAETDPDSRYDMLEFLPPDEQWSMALDVLHSNGHTKKDLEYYLYILLGANDEERCRRFLEQDTLKPIFILNFLLRTGASIRTTSTLDELLTYFRSRSCYRTRGKGGNDDLDEGVQSRARLAMQTMTPDEFSRLMSRFANHCRRLEPRLLVTLAEVVAERIQWHEQEFNVHKRSYFEQCRLFNSALRTFASRAQLGTHHKQVPNAYFWEAQRVLIGMSDQLPKPLAVNKAGFKAIRAVLAGMPKNQTELHSARRYSPTWPPYLHPGDGMDEIMEPEDSWTRTVRAGTMMQEAGFSKDQTDESLDILQGLAYDGTPTIQQRIPVNSEKQIRVWAASIKATRNAHEAWDRFRHPPSEGLEPGLDEYAAMFEKLFARDADLGVGKLPGDNSLNFPTQEELNLAEFEKARLRPPSVDELYQKMKQHGIVPNGQCLRILVSNAESLQTAQQYLMESALTWEQSSALLANDPEPESLKEIPVDVFSAYISVCSRERGHARRHMVRAMRLVEARLGHEKHPGASYLWMPILKNLGQHHIALGITLDEQLRLAIHLLDRFREYHGCSLLLFQRFARSLKSMLRREVIALLADMKLDNSAMSNSFGLIYDPDARQDQPVQEHDSTGEPPIEDEGGERSPTLDLARLAATRLTELFYSLVNEEREVQRLIGANEVSNLDAMLLRRDPVSGPLAHDYMVTLAFAGEFEEMAKALKWLVQEWGQEQLVQELESLDDVPHEADMLDMLCAFRAFAEPMLQEETVDSVLDAINASRVGWTWPDNFMVRGYLEGPMEHEANRNLCEVLQRVRENRQQKRQDRDKACGEEPGV